MDATGPPRLVRTLALLPVALLAGCAAAGPIELPNVGPNERFDVIWLKPDDASPRPHALEWEIVGATVEEGITRIETTTRGIEGGDFRFTLSYRETDERGFLRLTHDEALSAPGTFNFTYIEAIFWSGRDIRAVASVSNASYVELAPMDGREHYHQGTFHLDFEGRCDARCEGGARTILEGRFLVRR